jgi:hypothetical protein
VKIKNEVNGRCKEWIFEIIPTNISFYSLMLLLWGRTKTVRIDDGIVVELLVIFPADVCISSLIVEDRSMR